MTFCIIIFLKSFVYHFDETHLISIILLNYKNFNIIFVLIFLLKFKKTLIDSYIGKLSVSLKYVRAVCNYMDNS